ncbi:hypothetical protein [Curtobacterium sp. 179-B 9B NHS]|uniref:hypothetical protein n=1 Tax=Curtobacterium sp. 179-B 9B NHS TaxID=3374293 RepID=UPI0038798B44
MHAEIHAGVGVDDDVAASFARRGRLVQVGADTPGRPGVLDASECPPTFAADQSQVVGLITGGQVALTTAVEGAEDDEDAAVRDLDALGLTADDVVVGISASGRPRPPYVLSAIRGGRGAAPPRPCPSRATRVRPRGGPRTSRSTSSSVSSSLPHRVEARPQHARAEEGPRPATNTLHSPPTPPCNRTRIEATDHQTSTANLTQRQNNTLSQPTRAGGSELGRCIDSFMSCELASFASASAARPDTHASPYRYW